MMSTSSWDSSYFGPNPAVVTLYQVGAPSDLSRWAAERALLLQAVAERRSAAAPRSVRGSKQSVWQRARAVIKPA